MGDNTDPSLVFLLLFLLLGTVEKAALISHLGEEIWSGQRRGVVGKKLLSWTHARHVSMPLLLGEDVQLACSSLWLFHLHFASDLSSAKCIRLQEGVDCGVSFSGKPWAPKIGKDCLLLSAWRANYSQGLLGQGGRSDLLPGFRH